MDTMSLFSDIIGFNYGDDDPKTRIQTVLPKESYGNGLYSDTPVYTLLSADTLLQESNSNSTLDMGLGAQPLIGLDDSYSFTADQPTNGLGASYAFTNTQSPVLDEGPLSLADENLKLPDYLEELVGEIALEPNFPDIGKDTNQDLILDLDINAASLWEDEDSLTLDTIDPNEIMSSNSSSPAPSTASVSPGLQHHGLLEHTSLPEPRRTRPKRKTAERARTILSTMEPEASSSTHQYPSLLEVRISDDEYIESTHSKDKSLKPRQRRPRVSYSTLTEEEKYHRIRELNNEASRLYRERHRKTSSQLQEQEQTLLERNKVLKAKAAAMEALAARMKQFSEEFIRQHMS